MTITKNLEIDTADFLFRASNLAEISTILFLVIDASNLQGILLFIIENYHYNIFCESGSLFGPSSRVPKYQKVKLFS